MTKKRPAVQTSDGKFHAVRGEFYESIAEVLRTARSKSYRAVNFIMVEAYWNVGRMIVEEEQHGKDRAEYGKGLLKNLAARLTVDFGEPFSERNLRHFRQFYQCFPIRNALRSESDQNPDIESPSDSPDVIRYAVRSELRWTHYRVPGSGDVGLWPQSPANSWHPSGMHQLSNPEGSQPLAGG